MSSVRNVATTASCPFTCRSAATAGTAMSASAWSRPSRVTVTSTLSTGNETSPNAQRSANTSAATAVSTLCPGWGVTGTGVPSSKTMLPSRGSWAAPAATDSMPATSAASSRVDTTPISSVPKNDARRVNGLSGCAPIRARVPFQSMPMPTCDGTSSPSVSPAVTATAVSRRGSSCACRVPATSSRGSPPMSMPATVTPRGTFPELTARSMTYSAARTVNTPPTISASVRFDGPDPSPGGPPGAGSAGTGGTGGGGLWGGIAEVRSCGSSGRPAPVSPTAADGPGRPPPGASGVPDSTGMAAVGASDNAASSLGRSTDDGASDDGAADDGASPDARTTGWVTAESASSTSESSASGPAVARSTGSGSGTDTGAATVGGSSSDRSATERDASACASSVCESSVRASSGTGSCESSGRDSSGSSGRSPASSTFSAENCTVGADDGSYSGTSRSGTARSGDDSSPRTASSAFSGSFVPLLPLTGVPSGNARTPTDALRMPVPQGSAGTGARAYR